METGWSFIAARPNNNKTRKLHYKVKIIVQADAWVLNVFFLFCVCNTLQHWFWWILLDNVTNIDYERDETSLYDMKLKQNKRNSM